MPEQQNTNGCTEESCAGCAHADSCSSKKEDFREPENKYSSIKKVIDVVAPDYLSVSVEEDTDGTYYASPVILNADGSPYGEKDASEFGRKFKNRSKAQRSYMGKDRTYYVFDQE